VNNRDSLFSNGRESVLTAYKSNRPSIIKSENHIPQGRFTGKPQMKTSEELLIEKLQRKREAKLKEKQKRMQYYLEKVAKAAA
jgi:hypothetical protein